MKQPHVPRLYSRRDWLRGASGMGSLALTYLLAQDGWLDRALGATSSPNPLAAKQPHHKARAKAVIWLFMEGGPSHVDLFDPKPMLGKLAGQPMPASFGRPITAMGTANNSLMPTKRTFQNYGQSGIPVSDWYPHIAEHVDDLAVIRSCWANGLNHVGSVSQMNTGDILAGRPAMGAWVTYGLGTANENLPTFVILLDEREPVGGTKNWSSGFLPAVYQGTQFRGDDTQILYLNPPDTIGDKQQRHKLELLGDLNRHFAAGKGEDTELEARLKSYELAYHMQSSAQEAVDLTKESEATRKLYGLDNELTAKFGANCLLARRLVERNVRFVELYCGSAADGTRTPTSRGTMASGARCRTRRSPGC